MAGKEKKLRPTNTRTKFNRTIIDYLCDEQPQFRHVYSYFFSPIKEGIDWRLNLNNYLKFIEKIAWCPMLSRRYPYAHEAIVRDGKLVPEEYNKLIDAFYDIAELDYDEFYRPSY